MSFRNLSVADADAQTRAGAITLVDVRPPEERAIASVPSISPSVNALRRFAGEARYASDLTRFHTRI